MKTMTPAHWIISSQYVNGRGDLSTQQGHHQASNSTWPVWIGYIPMMSLPASYSFSSITSEGQIHCHYVWLLYQVEIGWVPASLWKINLYVAPHKVLQVQLGSWGAIGLVELRGRGGSKNVKASSGQVWTTCFLQCVTWNMVSAGRHHAVSLCLSSLSVSPAAVCEADEVSSPPRIHANAAAAGPLQWYDVTVHLITHTHFVWGTIAVRDLLFWANQLLTQYMTSWS